MVYLQLNGVVEYARAAWSKGNFGYGVVEYARAGLE